MPSFCAELAGLHDTLGYALKHGNRNAEYEMFCDNESVLKVLEATKEPTVVELSKNEGKINGTENKGHPAAVQEGLLAPRQEAPG